MKNTWYLNIGDYNTSDDNIIKKMYETKYVKPKNFVHDTDVFNYINTPNISDIRVVGKYFTEQTKVLTAKDWL